MTKKSASEETRFFVMKAPVFSLLLANALRTGLRARPARAVLAIAVLLVACAVLAASFSPRQPRIVLLDVGFSGIRIGLIVLALSWTDLLFSRMWTGPQRYFALLQPVSRATHVVVAYFSILFLLALSALGLGLALLGLASLDWPGSTGAFSAYGRSLAVIFGLWCDAAVVASFVMLASSLCRTPVLPYLLGAAFALAGKGLGPTLEYVGEQGASAASSLVQPAVAWLPYLLPDLSRLDWRVSVLYGQALPPAMICWALLMAFTYAVVMVMLTSIAVSRRDVS